MASSARKRELMRGSSVSSADSLCRYFRLADTIHLQKDVHTSVMTFEADYY